MVDKKIDEKKRAEPRMRVVINALQYRTNGSGISVMLRELIGAYTKLAERPCQVVLPGDEPGFPAGAEIIHCPWRRGQDLRRIFFQTVRLGRRYCRGSVLLINDSKTPLFLPKNCVLVPLVSDMAVYRLPETYQRSRVLLWRFQYRYVRRRADFFLAVSEFTKQEITELLKIPAEKIYVVPCACPAGLRRVVDLEDLARLREKYELPKQYILFVGNANPRKNLKRTIRAFDLLKEQTGLPHQLVIAGGQGWKFDRKKALEGIYHRDAVRFIGFVPDEDMSALYSAASLFVFSTLYEGFGIPVLEAQVCGVPVVVSDGSALREVAGDSAELVDPYNTESICSGMRRVLEDAALAKELVEKGYSNVKRFSWESSARQMKEILEREIGP